MSRHSASPARHTQQSRLVPWQLERLAGAAAAAAAAVVVVVVAVGDAMAAPQAFGRVGLERWGWGASRWVVSDGS